jgi:hypothetical protein
VFLLMLARWHRYICWTCPREVHCWKQSSQGFKRSELGEDWETVWNIHVSGAAGRIHQLDTRQRSKNPRVLPISTPYFSGCSSVSLLKNCTYLRLRNGGYGVHVSAAKRLNTPDTIAIWNSVHMCSQHPDISWSSIISHYIKFWTLFPTSYYYIDLYRLCIYHVWIYIPASSSGCWISAFYEISAFLTLRRFLQTSGFFLRDLMISRKWPLSNWCICWKWLKQMIEKHQVLTKASKAGTSGIPWSP